MPAQWLVLVNLLQPGHSLNLPLPELPPMAYIDEHVRDEYDRSDTFQVQQVELSPIERAVLWIGAYEFQHCLDVPWRVVINECVELAKSFGGTDGHKYVNGVLNKIASQLRPAEVAASPSAARKPASRPA